MRYRRLGECGLKISELSLGTWQTHNSHNTAGAVQVTRRAYELGVNLFDTANEYQDGAAEEGLGRREDRLYVGPVGSALEPAQSIGDQHDHRFVARRPTGGERRDRRF